MESISTRMQQILNGLGESARDVAESLREHNISGIRNSVEIGIAARNLSRTGELTLRPAEQSGDIEIFAEPEGRAGIPPAPGGEAKGNP